MEGESSVEEGEEAGVFVYLEVHVEHVRIVEGFYLGLEVGQETVADQRNQQEQTTTKVDS